MLLAVSGGLDSMVMLQLFLKTGFRVGVAHCNFQLRGEESDGDERFVREVCQNQSIPFHVSRFETEAYARSNNISTQMAARELRYKWFDDLMVQGYGCLATAHHFNDSMETILMNWINGGSLEALTGIPVKNGRIIRPLLFATRDELHQFALENSISWREDSSNDSVDYQRNFIRHRVIPGLKELNPSLERTIEYGLEKLKGEYGFFDAAFKDWERNFVAYAGDRIIISKKGFEKFPDGAPLLWRLLKHLGFNYDVCANIMATIHGQPGKMFRGAHHELTVDRDYLLVTPGANAWNDVVVGESESRAILGSWQMMIGLANDHNDYAAGYGSDRYTARLDAAKVKFPLHWRQWKPGDAFYPLGMEHRKKVSDLLIDEKVSRADKSWVTVLESEGQIIWVVGHRIDNRFKITEQTQRAIQFTVTPYFVE